MVVHAEDPVIRGFVRRLNQALDAIPVEQRGRPRYLADALKLTVAATQKYFNGQALPKGTRWQQLANVLQVSVTWLRDGVGPMKGDNDPIAKELWELWPQLDEDTKRDLVGTARVKARSSRSGPFQAISEKKNARLKTA